MVIKLAQMCGLIDGITNAISKWFSETLGNIVSGILYYFYSVAIGPLLLIIDIINALFRKFAGLGTYYDQAAHGVLSGDFVYSLITSRAVTNVFWAMIILAVILLIITTFIAVIKSEFTPIMDKSNNNNKRKIIGIAVKSLINFAVVPICAVIGVLIGNALLRTIDGATGGGEGSSMGGRIFVAGAYDANIIRKYVNNPELDDVRLVKCRDNIVNEFYGSGATWNTLSENQKNELADLVDDLFSQGITNITQSKYFYLSADMIGYYDLLSFNFFLCLICVVAIGYFMIMILIGLIKRIFAMVTLFVIAPPIIALSPINGKVLESWNKLFIKNMLAAYSSVVAINLYLIVLRALQNVQFFTPNEFGLIGGEGFANQIAYMLIMIGGLVFTKDLTKDVAGLIGADSALSEGISASKEFAATTGKMVGLGATVMAPAINGLRAATAMPGRVVRGLGSHVSAPAGGPSAPSGGPGGSPTNPNNPTNPSGGNANSSGNNPTQGAQVNTSAGLINDSEVNNGETGSPTPTGGNGGGTPGGSLVNGIVSPEAVDNVEDSTPSKDSKSDKKRKALQEKIAELSEKEEWAGSEGYTKSKEAYAKEKEKNQNKLNKLEDKERNKEHKEFVKQGNKKFNKHHKQLKKNLKDTKEQINKEEKQQALKEKQQAKLQKKYDDADKKRQQALKDGNIKDVDKYDKELDAIDNQLANPTLPEPKLEKIGRGLLKGGKAVLKSVPIVVNGVVKGGQTVVNGVGKGGKFVSDKLKPVTSAVKNDLAAMGNAIVGSEMVEAFDKGRKAISKGGFHDPTGEGKKKSDDRKRQKENRELAKEIADAIKQADKEKNNSAKPAQKVKIDDESIRGLGKQIGKDISGEVNNAIKGLATELEKTVEKLKKDDNKK